MISEEQPTKKKQRANNMENENEMVIEDIEEHEHQEEPMLQENIENVATAMTTTVPARTYAEDLTMGMNLNEAPCLEAFLKNPISYLPLQYDFISSYVEVQVFVIFIV